MQHVNNGGAPVAKDVHVDSGLPSAVWLIGWLFTIGFLHLSVKQSLLGIVIWAYYLGHKLGHV
jgi:hypothetical protein